MSSNPSTVEKSDALAGLSFRKAPLHVQVRENLRTLIHDQFKPGDKFYSEPELIRNLEVSQGTIRRALTDLSAEGLLIRRVPHGTFVAERVAGAPTLGVFMPKCDSAFLMEMLELVSRECRKRLIGVTIHQTHRGEDLNEALTGIDAAPGRDRILLLGETAETAVELYRHFSRNGVRVINFDTSLPDLGEPYVGVDNGVGIRLGIDHLVKLNHRRITLLVNEPIASGNIQERVAHFEQYCGELGLGEARVVECGTRIWSDSAKAAFAHMEEVMGVDTPPTAILTVSATGAWGALKWLQINGISVPSEVSLLCYDDPATNQYMHPALTSIAQPHEEMADRIVDLILRKTPPGPERFLLPPKLVERESCAKLEGNV